MRLVPLCSRWLGMGAGKPDRAEQSVWRTGLYNMLFLGTIGIFFVVFATPVVRLFVNDPVVVPIAAMALRTIEPVLRRRLTFSSPLTGPGFEATG